METVGDILFGSVPATATDICPTSSLLVDASKHLEHFKVHFYWLGHTDLGDCMWTECLFGMS